jgi:hypothetical protein
MASLTDVQETPLCPEISEDAPGIVIDLAPRPVKNSPLVIHGTYLVPWAQAELVEPPLHRALVLVIQNGETHHVATPFRARVLFGDDERETRNGTLGHFSMDVFELQGGFATGDYHLLVSLGELVSNVVRVQIV